jgi:hypothetical protein
MKIKYTTFIMLCGKYMIDPDIALEHPNLRQLLQSETITQDIVDDFLKNNF